MVVGFGDAVLADAAMLGASGLEQLAGSTVGAWMEHGEIEGILSHLKNVALGGDVSGVCGGGEPEENVGTDDGDGGCELLGGVEEGPDGGQVHGLAADEQSNEEDEDGGMSLIHHVIAKASHGHRQTSAGDALVEDQEGAGDCVPHEAMEP